MPSRCTHPWANWCVPEGCLVRCVAAVTASGHRRAIIQYATPPTTGAVPGARGGKGCPLASHGSSMTHSANREVAGRGSNGAASMALGAPATNACASTRRDAMNPASASRDRTSTVCTSMRCCCQAGDPNPATPPLSVAGAATALLRGVGLGGGGFLDGGGAREGGAGAGDGGPAGAGAGPAAGNGLCIAGATTTRPADGGVSAECWRDAGRNALRDCCDDDVANSPRGAGCTCGGGVPAEGGGAVPARGSAAANAAWGEGGGGLWRRVDTHATRPPTAGMCVRRAWVSARGGT
jgi:hypothetical protein